MALEAELAILHLGSLLIRCCHVDVRVSEQQSHLYRLLLCRLSHAADVHCQLAQGTNVALVYELHLWKMSFVEDYAHDGLTSTHGAVDFGVDFVNTHRITHSHEGIKYIFTKLLALDDYLLAFWMDIGIKDCESIDAVSLLGDT